MDSSIPIYKNIFGMKGCYIKIENIFIRYSLNFLKVSIILRP